MTVELVLTSGATVVLDGALFDRARREWSGVVHGRTRMTVPVADTLKQRLVVDAEGRPVGGGNIDSDQHRGRRCKR